MEAPALGLYVAASLALIATPGQDMVYVVGRALAQGRLAGVLSALGVCLGILVHTALAALGIGALIHASETLFFALKVAGAGYLVYLGVKLLRTQEAWVREEAPARLARPAALVWQGLLSNVTNPKMAIFFFAFLPQFVTPASEHPTRELVALGVLYAALALPVKGAVGWFAGGFAERALRSPVLAAWLRRASGVVLVGLGVRLAAGER